MPKKLQFTSTDQEFLEKRLIQSRSIFLEFRSIASSYFHQRDRVRIRTDRILEDFDELLRELKVVKPE